MEFTAKQIADFLKGEIAGDETVKVSGFSEIDKSKTGTLSFLANPKYLKYIYKTKSSIVLVRKTLKPEKKIPATLIKVEDPYIAFTQLLQMASEYLQNSKKGIANSTCIHPTATIKNIESAWIGENVVISENVSIGKNVKIYPLAYIGENVSIGDNCIIYAGVKINPACQIGNNCIIQSGVIIGSDGFGFAPDAKGKFIKIPQLGNVILEDDVEIGANSTIDRATIGSTIIKKGTKIDNLVQVAHNCVIGENNAIAAQAGFAGSSKTGKNCMIGGQAGISGHISIGNNVMIGAQSGIRGDIPDNSKLLGSPAIDASQYKRVFVHFKNLNKIVKRIEQLEKKF